MVGLFTIFLDALHLSNMGAVISLGAERMNLRPILLAGLFSVVTLGYSQGPVSPAQASVYTITILGAVHRPGAYEIKAGQTVSLLQMLAKAGGLTKYAKMKAVEIARAAKMPQGALPEQAETIRVNLDSIFSGKAPDMKIEPGDVISVPSNDKKEDDRAPGLLAGILN